MNRLFPLPIYTFLKIAFQQGGFTGKGLLNTLPWLLKAIIFEPIRWIELATKNKSIRKHTITNTPIFILGYYRSGTTYLQQLFMRDDRLGFTSAFQTIFPETMLTTEKWLTPVMETFAKLFKQQNYIHRIPLTWHGPGEDDVALTAFMSPLAAQWGYFYPQKMMEYFHKYVLFENIPETEMEKWEKNYLLLLKKISLANKGKQLVLKNPPNTARIKLLLSLFPDAKFIHIHRNPYDVYASKKQVWNVIQKNYRLGSRRSVDDNNIVLDTYTGIMNRYIAEKDLIPAQNLLEIEYEDLFKTPLETMRHIYASLRLGDFNHCENEMRVYADQQKKYVVLNHNLPAEEIKIVSEKLEPFIRHWNYPVL